MTADPHRLVRLVFSGLNDIEEWKLGDPAHAVAKGYPRKYTAEVLDDHGMVFVDVTLDARNGKAVCHEVNGPNGVGSDALTGESSLRAANEARHAVRRARESGRVAADGRLRHAVVTIHAHQHWGAFRTGGEFYPRVDRFAERIAASFPGSDVRLRGPSEALGDEDVTVVAGDVPSVAAGLEVEPTTRRLEYRGRPVIFAGNPNLVSELVRTGKLPYGGDRGRDVDLRVFHAWRLVHVFHDKTLQQLLLHGTGIEPLRHFEASTPQEALRQTKAMLRHGPVVLKPNGTSGGAGVHVVVPGMTDDAIERCIDTVIADCVAKYGDNVEAALFPLRGFEFIRSTGYPMEDGDHLWDLRIAVLFAPGAAEVFPVSLRIAPKPFDPASFHLDRDQWISNVSGRARSLLKSGMDDEALAAVGMTDDKLEEIFRTCARWTTAAWDCSMRNAAPIAIGFEDECERADGSFYPSRKFRV